jgi:hypothetical protein
MVEHVAFCVLHAVVNRHSVAEDLTNRLSAVPSIRRSRTASPARYPGRGRRGRPAATRRRPEFSVDPSHGPSASLSPSVVIPSAAMLVRPCSSIPSSIIAPSRRSESGRFIRFRRCWRVQCTNVRDTAHFDRADWRPGAPDGRARLPARRRTRASRGRGRVRAATRCSWSTSTPARS